MAYSEFTYETLRGQFGLKFVADRRFEEGLAAVPASQLLAATLAQNTTLALNMNTEKARSELIIAPVLVEVHRFFGGKVSLFSGADFNVAPERGLAGICDFLLGLSVEQFTPAAPAICVVEAKKLDPNDGIPQCAAAMLAARIFNERDGISLPSLHGCVTTGNRWRFLTLTGEVVSVSTEFGLEPVERILGAFVRALKEGQSAYQAAPLLAN